MTSSNRNSIYLYHIIGCLKFAISYIFEIYIYILGILLLRKECLSADHCLYLAMLHSYSSIELLIVLSQIIRIQFFEAKSRLKLVRFRCLNKFRHFRRIFISVDQHNAEGVTKPSISKQPTKLNLINTSIAFTNFPTGKEI